MGEEITEVLEIIEIPFNSVVYNKYGNVGYIRINRFSLTTFDCFNDALTNLEELGIEGLVIDVRDNGGGYLGAVYNILKLFLDGDEPLFIHIDHERMNTLIICLVKVQHANHIQSQF